MHTFMTECIYSFLSLKFYDSCKLPYLTHELHYPKSRDSLFLLRPLHLLLWYSFLARQISVISMNVPSVPTIKRISQKLSPSPSSSNTLSSEPVKLSWSLCVVVVALVAGQGVFQEEVDVVLRPVVFKQGQKQVLPSSTVVGDDVVL